MTNTTDALIAYKKAQREGWGLFAPLDLMTTLVAPALVNFSMLKPGQSVLDAGCGTGVVAITAAQQGATVSGLDLSPGLLQRAEHHKTVAQVDVDFTEGDVEALPYPDASFDVVLSQFGHMFAPNAQLALDELLRVLKPGGTIAFSTWPPEHFAGRLFNLISHFNPPPITMDAPAQWGSPDIVKKRLGDQVCDLVFDYKVMHFPALSLNHYCQSIEKTLGPVVKFIEKAKDDTQKIADFRKQVTQLAKPYFKDNKIHQTFLMTRAKKIN